MTKKVKLTENERRVFLAIKSCLRRPNGAEVEEFLNSRGADVPRSSVYSALFTLERKGFIKARKRFDGTEDYSVQESGVKVIQDYLAMIQLLRDAAGMIYQGMRLLGRA